MAAVLIRIWFLFQLRLFWSRIAALRGEKKRKVAQKGILKGHRAIFKQLQCEKSKLPVTMVLFDDRIEDTYPFLKGQASTTLN